MTSEELRNIIECGETSVVQFKQEFTTQKEMATEMIAFANGRDGTITGQCSQLQTSCEVCKRFAFSI